MNQSLIQQTAVAAMVVTTLISVGLRTSLADFRGTFQAPLRQLGLVVVNLLVVPVLTLALARATGCSDAMVAGFLICAACPGGATGPLFASQARGHLAAAIAGMVGLSLLAVPLSPLLLARLLGTTVELDPHRLLLPMIGTLGIFQLLPLVVGMTLRARAPMLAARLAPPLGRLANVLLLAVIVGLLLVRGHAISQVGLKGAALSMGLVLLNLGMGALLSRDRAIRRSLSMVTGVRNISLAILLSTLYFSGPLIEAAILTFGLFTMAVPFVVATLLSRRQAT